MKLHFLSFDKFKIILLSEPSWKSMIIRLLQCQCDKRCQWHRIATWHAFVIFFFLGPFVIPTRVFLWWVNNGGLQHCHAILGFQEALRENHYTVGTRIGNNTNGCGILKSARGSRCSVLGDFWATSHASQVAWGQSVQSQLLRAWKLGPRTSRGSRVLSPKYDMMPIWQHFLEVKIETCVQN